MSLYPNTFIEHFPKISQSNVKDIWSVDSVSAFDETHKDLYMKLSKQAEEIAALTNLCQTFKAQADEASSLKAGISSEFIALKGDISSEIIALKGDIECKIITVKGDINCEINSLKAEIKTLKNQLESLFNKGFILRNKNTKTLMRVATNPPNNHYDIVANRLSCGIALEYTPPSRSAKEGGKAEENIIWTLEHIQ